MAGFAADELTIRAHDIVASMEDKRTVEYDLLTTLGLAARLALHLRGVPVLEYELVRKVAVHLLNFQPAEVKPVLQLLAEAEFVLLITEGTTIKSVVPQVPYFDSLYTKLGEAALGSASLNEAEQLTVELARLLSASPTLKEQVYALGAERKLVDSVLQIGDQAKFVLTRRARGRDVLISPTHFAENEAAYCDLVAAQGGARVKKVLTLLRQNQGWPLALLERDAELQGVKLDDRDLAVVRALAGDGFVRPPAIETTHHGTNYFLFGPRPGAARLPSFKRTVYEAAMALVAAMRQGQLLPAQYRIRSPYTVLSRLKERGYIGANSEALEQYRNVVQLKVGFLEPAGGDRYRFRLRDQPEAKEAVELAIQLVQGSDLIAHAADDIVLALRKGEAYVESLIGRKRLVGERPVALSPEDQFEMEKLLLGGQI